MKKLPMRKIETIILINLNKEEKNNMTTVWNLDVIYKGLTDPAYEADVKAFEEAVASTKEVIEKAKALGAKEKVEMLLLQEEKVYELCIKLMCYVELASTVDTSNGELMAQNSRLHKIYSAYAPYEAAIKKMYAEIETLEDVLETSELAKEYSFRLKEMKEDAKYLFSDEVEAMITSMDMFAGTAWNKLQGFMTSTLKVDYDGGQITLPEVRNLAYSPDADVRKKAYEAEVAAYEKIQDGVAFAINNIKTQVTMLCNKRGYKSVLDMTLKQSRLKRETLDAMMEAIKEALPVFRKYLRKKAEMLGYENGLPWYELFAPMGKADKTYTIEEAKEYLTTCFKEFSPQMSDMMARAFDEEWIDFYPKKGKVGGAFCYGVPCLKQSRILTNFDGSFSSVGTLAHELGHAYHNLQIENERSLNQDYPMPVAETASTFNEVHLGEYALKRATAEEKLNLLENDLKEQTQVIMDIYSRYLFETAVFEQSQSKFLMADDLNKLMLAAQKEAYGDGLDPNYLNQGMWICKGHYYSANLSFYNFPYAFGDLFALGLYSLFEKEGASFVEKYNALLNATATCTAEEAGKMVGIDLTDKAFWKAGLEQIAKKVEAFVKL